MTVIFIGITNPNFDLSHNRNKAGDRVPHYHFEKEFGDPGMASLTEMRAAATAFYSGHTITELSPPDLRRNCHCVSFHGYPSGSLANYFAPSSLLYEIGLKKIAPSSEDNTYFDTVAGDRCNMGLFSGGNHSWVIVSSPAGKAALEIRFENSYFGEYSYSTPETGTGCNDAPGNTGGYSYGEKYDVWNVTPR
ncbi:MAG: hypothetical protein HYV26_16925 [Candidatus Hydrogenedentes bacterium]|nr:hypothetical protein [Candidatus Hydrogenedentota bacterium]